MSVLLNQCSSLLLVVVNQDGSVDALFVQPFVDLLIAGEFQAEANINQDGAGALLDVDPVVAAVSGTPAAQAVVPEPSTWCLLIAAVFGLAGYRWRRS